MRHVLARGLLAGALAGLLLTGCDGGGQGVPSPSVTPTSSAPSSADPSGGPSPSAQVTPANGPAVRSTAYQLRVPQGFTVDETYRILITARGPGSRDRFSAGTLTGMPEQSLRDLVASARTHSSWDRPPDRLPDVTLDGVRFFHLRGTLAPIFHVEEYGAWHDGTLVSLRFELAGPPAGRTRVVESTLATFAWR